MASRLFTHPGAWTGSYYELAVDLGPVDDARLERALVALWSHSDLAGCCLNRDREPSEQASVSPGSVEPQSPLYGVVTLGTLGQVACATFVVREEGGSDWVYFAMPMGSLATVLPVGTFPFDDGSDLAWRSVVDDWLCRLAEHLFTTVRFRVGLVGSVDGLDGATDELLDRGAPKERWAGYLMPSGEALRWYPPTEGAPFGFG